jgi:hypothetical protein
LTQNRWFDFNVGRLNIPRGEGLTCTRPEFG